MFDRRRVWTTLFLIVLLNLNATGLVSAQAGPSGQVYIPLVSGGNGAKQFAPTGVQLHKAPVTDVYVVLMNDAPVATYAGDIAGLAATAPQAGSKIEANSVDVQNYVTYLQESQDAVLAATGVSAEQKLYSYTYALNGFAAHLHADQVSAMATQPGVKLVLQDEFRFIEQDESAQDESAQGEAAVDTSVQTAEAEANSLASLDIANPQDAWTQNYNGEGVLVGIIDTGIWPEHPSFADNGSYSPWPLEKDQTIACNFGNTAYNPKDKPFTCNNKLIGAYQFLKTYKSIPPGLTAAEFDSARDDEGHGTHTASTVAGNANVNASIFGIPRGKVSGIAPRARIIAYKALGEGGGYGSDLAMAIEQAIIDGVDVINYSIGGGASLLTADALAFLSAIDAGLFVAVSAGNSGPGPATVGGPAAVPWVTAVGAHFPNRAYISDITLSGPSHTPRGVWGGSITRGISNYRLVDAAGIADTTGDKSGQCLNPFPAGVFKSTDAVLCSPYTFGEARTTRVLNVKKGGGGAVLFLNDPSVNVTPTDNHVLPTVHMLYSVGLPLKQYLAANKGKVKISFTTGQARYAGQDRRVTPNVMTSFSSRGPNPIASDILKPDVTAPGYQILAGNSPINTTTAAQNELYQAIMGTSMSSPHVAGLFALIRQAHPDWTPAMARSALMTTASQQIIDSDFHSPADPFEMGAGGVDAGIRQGKASMFQPALVYDADLLDYLGFFCEAAPNTLVSDGDCAFLTSIGVPTDASDLNLPSIGMGELVYSQVVTRRLTSVVTDNDLHTYKVSIDAPRGFSVSVNPTVIRLRKGESASYQVTFTFKGTVPVNTWHFGALTWVERERGRDILVRSPLVVRAASLDAPDLVQGSGESGTASFNVKFGYSGNYLAQPHGLLPPTLTAGTVVQDPGQVFDPNDGFSTLHPINVNGTLHLRVAIPPEATDDPTGDLDVYVYDPNGAFYALSGNEGTDEVVDIPQPMNGTWFVFVHGWDAPGGNTAYNLYSWIVPSTAGGSLQVTSAPTSVTNGATATIGISWSGAIDSKWYLGAVSHHHDSELLGVTLVEVDNRP